VAAVLQGTMSAADNAGFRLMRDDDDSIGIEAQIISFVEVADAHPRFQYADTHFPIPEWLQNCFCIYMDKLSDDPPRVNLVHKLYHKTLDNKKDRLHMASAIAVCETFAICRPSPTGDIAIAAISYGLIGVKVLVTFLAVDDRYHQGGFGTMLLQWLIITLKYRVSDADDPLQDNDIVFSVFLFANEISNQKAWKFYINRGMKPAPLDLSESIQEFMDHEDFKRFVNPQDNGEALTLLCHEDFDNMSFGYSAAKTNVCYLLDPLRPMHDAFEDPMMYALFPGNSSLGDWNHCGKQLLL
jgi:GNAT superfamily N-acetyltransferase